MGGGLGYTEQQLRAIWSARFDIAVLRRMREQDAESTLFGLDVLWCMLAFKRESAGSIAAS